MSNIDDYRVDCMIRGISIVENAFSHPITGTKIINISMSKVDQPYNLLFTAQSAIPADQYGTNQYFQNLIDMSEAIERSIDKRHHSNPNTCSHEVVISDGKKVCRKCLAILGHQINVDVNYN